MTINIDSSVYSKIKLHSALCLIRNGMNIKQGVIDGGLPITRIETISDGNIDKSKVGYAGLSEIDANGYFLEDGDVLLSHINSTTHLGKTAFYSKNEHGSLVHGMNLLCLRANKNFIFPKYLSYALESKVFKTQIPRISKKSVNQASIAISDLKELEIPIPYASDRQKSLTEQKRIAAILDKANAIRRKRQQAIQLADDFLRAVFLDMFGDPNANSKGIDVKPMTEFFDITTGKLNSNAAKVDGKYPFFTCAKEVFAIDEFAFDQEALLLAGNNAQAEYDVKHYKGKFNAYQRTYVLTLNNKNNSYPFYKYALEYQLQNLKRVSKGTSTKYITLEIMERTMLPAPDFDLQNRFVGFYERHREIIGSNIKSLESMNNNFNSLSQRVFSGSL